MSDERHINIHATPEVMAGVYANFANVSHSDYEFSMTFIRLDHESETEEEINGVVVSRVNMSPRFMQELLEAISDNLSKWQAAENIKNLPEAPGHEASTVAPGAVDGRRAPISRRAAVAARRHRFVEAGVAVVSILRCRAAS